MQRRFKILVADPECDGYSKEMESYFASAHPDWQARFARAPEEAQAALDSFKPDAAVFAVEFTQGGREGVSLLFYVRRHLPNTPVILVSGSCDARALRDAFLSETVSDDMKRLEVDPEGFLFREEMGVPGNYGRLANLIADGLYKHGRVTNKTAVLVTHGTDTMAWGLAYLRYALKDLTANVAVTGSQVPLEGYFSGSDALGNLKTAVYLLNRLRPARLFAVFNNGKNVFSGRLTKYRKWDADAFDGKMAASAGVDGIRAMRSDWVLIPYEDQKLGDLHLIRTGGTIESARDSTDLGALKPTGDFVWKYLNDPLSGLFVNAHRHDLFSLDSSNVSYEEWAQIAEAIAAIGVARADTTFDLTVRPVFTNPLFTTEQYAAQFAACGQGVIFAGYGGGNANVREDSNRSVIPAFREAVAQGKLVAVTSQVPLEPYDVEYETGLSLLEAGGFPCGDLPLADAQVKLSYLLGHAGEVDEAAAEAGVDRWRLYVAAFLSGVSMRRAHGLETFRKVLGIGDRPLRILPQDPFAGRPFKEAIGEVVHALKGA